MSAIMEQPAEFSDEAPLMVSDAIVSALVEWGVNAVYGVSGANIEHFHDAIHRRGEGVVRSVLARSENGAAFMADAHARAAQTLGVCCSTSGGGMMNLTVGIAEAYQSRVPLLAIVGQPPRMLEGRGAFQDSSGLGRTVDAEALFRTIAKEVRVVRSGVTLWEDLEAAVRAAMENPSGPGVLLIPRDVFTQEAPPRPPQWPTRLDELFEQNLALPHEIAAIEAKLHAARNPVLLLGDGVRRSGATDSVVDFARCAQIPVATTMADVTAYPNDDALFLGTVGVAGHPSVHRYVNEEADLIMVLGCQLEVMVRAPITKGLDRAELIVIDEEVSLVKRSIAKVNAFARDIGTTVARLGAMTPERIFGHGQPEAYQQECFLPQLAEAVDADPSEVLQGEQGLLQSEAVMRLGQSLPGRGNVLFDAGNCAASAIHYMPLPGKTRTSIALGMGGMGYAIAGAIGAQIAQKESQQTTVICGDGAFMMLGMEVHTAVELGLPILFVVFNNGQHGMCVTRQQVFFQSRIEATRYPRVSVTDIVRGFGGSGSLWVGSAQTPEELDQALEELAKRDGKGPAVLELVLRREEVPPFTPFLDPDSPIGSLQALRRNKNQSRSGCAA